MPRAQDFSRSTIYHIRHIETRQVLYVGSTTNFNQRRYSHKSDCENVNGSRYHYQIYEYIRANEGWKMYEVIPVCHLSLTTSVELQIAEQREIDRYGNLLNERYAFRSRKDYLVDNKERISEYQQQQYASNVVEIKLQRQRYVEQNPAVIKTRAEQQKRWNQVQITCGCGCIITQKSRIKHQNSAKHFKLLEQLDQANYEPITLLPIAYDI